MAKREFVQLAHEYEPAKDCIAGFMVSEKLDGMRCYWDGGISRGIPKSQVPWANTDKDHRLLNVQMATGLWSRYGNVIHAPDEWLDALPLCPLDGELYSVDHSRQHIMSTIKKFAENRDDSAWDDINYFVFDRPAYETMFANGVMNNTNYKKKFRDIMPWVEAHLAGGSICPKPKTRFETNYNLLKKMLEGNKVAIAHKQELLPWSTAKAEARVTELLESISEAGGEGLILRAPGFPYICERTRMVLKVKKIMDAEATVIGYTTGRETDKGSKLLGLMGALIVEAHCYEHLPNGMVNKTIFEISGFTDAERELGVSLSAPKDRYFGRDAREWAIAHPGQEVPEWINNSNFPRGTVVTFKYRGVSDDGVPQEARYYRKREDI